MHITNRQLIQGGLIRYQYAQWKAAQLNTKGYH